MNASGRLFSVLIVMGVVGFLSEKHAPGQTGNPNPMPGIHPVQVSSLPAGQLNFQNAPVGVVLDLYELESGKHLIRDLSVQGMPSISVNATGVSKDEITKLISATLLLNNVALIPVDDQTLKVVTIGITKNPRSEGLRLYTAARDLPTDDQIVSYYMALDHITPQEAAGIFEQVSPPHTYGFYAPAPSANGIVLTENSSVIRELIDLKKQIDVRRDVVPPTLSGHPPPPGKGGLIFLLVIIAAAFAAGYYWARFRLRKK